MDKKTLKGIPINKFEIDTVVLIKNSNTYLINAYVSKEVLILDIYDKDIHIKCRMFQSKTEFVTLEDGKWRQSKLVNLLNCYPYPTYITTKKSEEVIKNYLNTEEAPVEAIMSLQDDIRKAELGNRHKSELDLIDSYMKPVGAVPEDFEQWINDVALIKSRYVVYEYKSGKTMKGKCTHCHADVLIEKPKHNLEGTCPNCKSKVIYKAKGKFNNVTDNALVQLVQKHPSGIVVREFRAWKIYSKLEGTKLSYREMNRCITGSENLEFAWDVFKQSGPLRWCKDKYWNTGTGVLYTENIQKELARTEFKYSGLSEIAKPDNSFSATDYLRAYQKGPALEYLSKLGLHNLVISMLHTSRYVAECINLKGKNPLEVLKLSKENLNRAIRINANRYEVEALQIAQQENVYIPENLFTTVVKDFGGHYNDFIRMAKLSNVNQLFKYTKTNDINFRDYRDYIDMATKLNWDVKDRFILFPRHFKASHDQAQELVEVKQTYAENKIIKSMFQQLNKRFEFSDEAYSVRLPMTAREIIREGHTLHHCVGTYVKSVASGKTLILFIRKKEDPHTPYFTLELNPKDYHITQVRGERNCGPDEGINKVLSDYKKNLSKIAC